MTFIRHAAVFYKDLHPSFEPGRVVLSSAENVCSLSCSDYSGNTSSARRAKKRSSGDSPADGQTLRSSGRQTTVRVKRTNNPPPGQVSCSSHAQALIVGCHTGNTKEERPVILVYA